MFCKNRVIIIIFSLLFIILCLSQFAAADNMDVYIYGKDVTKNLAPMIYEGQIMVRARLLADYIGAEIKWKKNIKTLKLIKDETVIKMMAGSPFIQIGDRAIESKNGMVLKNNNSYIPLKDVVRGFGFLINSTNNSLYIFKPEANVKEVVWENNCKLIIKMDKITPYRINEGQDPHKLIIEIDKASLASDFIDNVSCKNYYLDIKRSSKTARLQLVLTGKYPIPYYDESCIKEEGNNIVLNFYPLLKSIKWTNDNRLEILSSKSITKPDILLLSDPQRMVLDFTGLKLSDYDLDFKKNNYIKEVRVSQFKYEPLILRVVLELKDNRYLHCIDTEDNKKFVLGPATKTEISNLKYKSNKISFESTDRIKPEIFNLEEPNRLVINIHNALRGDNVKDKLTINNDLIKNIRSSRFDEQVIRVVVDLNGKIGYNWKQIEEENGKYKHIITLGNTLEKLRFINKKQKTNINIKFYDQVNYKVNKFSYPDRLVVDVLNTDLNVNQLDIPKNEGIIKEVRVDKYINKDKEYTRFVFELKQFHGYEVISAEPASNINITLAKKIFKVESTNNLIILDPGHGGFDPGACGQSGLTEKEVNLDIALKLKDILNNSGYQVILTRNKDKFISLRERVELANKKEARIFVSIHNNSSSKNYSEGTETFLAPNREEECLLLAQLLQKELLSELELVDRGVKKDNFYVIKYTNMPAVLLEIAFLSNPHEETLLESDLFRQNAAEAVARAIGKYFDRVN